jgi:hypothetical protein
MRPEKTSPRSCERCSLGGPVGSSYSSVAMTSFQILLTPPLRTRTSPPIRCMHDLRYAERRAGRHMRRKGAFGSSQGAAVVFTFQGMIDDEGVVGLGRALADTRTALEKGDGSLFFSGTTHWLPYLLSEYAPIRMSVTGAARNKLASYACLGCSGTDWVGGRLPCWARHMILLSHIHMHV